MATRLAWFVARPRFLYATIFTWISFSSGRFLAPFLEHEGKLSGTDIGLFLAIQQLAFLVSSPSVGRFADDLEKKYQGRGRAIVLAVGVILGTICVDAHYLTKIFTISNVLRWWILLLLRIIYATTQSMVFPVMDGICVRYVEENSRPEDYGKERLYGAITWAIAHVSMAPFLESGFFIIYPLSTVSGLVVVLSVAIFSWSTSVQKYTQLSRRSSTEMNGESTATKEDVGDSEQFDPHVSSTGDKSTIDDPTSSATHDLIKLSSRDLLGRLIGGTRSCFCLTYGLGFLIAIVALAAGQVIVDSLIFLFFEYLGSSYTLMGWTVVLTVVFEIPVFLVSDRLLDYFGAKGLLQLAMICYIVRVLGYTLIPRGHVGFALFLEPMHGITYACSQTASVDYVAKSMPEGYEASGQGIVYFIRGVGSILGLLGGGYAEDAVGPRILYRVAALVVSTGLGVVSYGGGVGENSTLSDLELTERRDEGLEITCDDDVESAVLT